MHVRVIGWLVPAILLCLDTVAAHADEAHPIEVFQALPDGHMTHKRMRHMRGYALGRKGERLGLARFNRRSITGSIGAPSIWASVDLPELHDVSIHMKLTCRCMPRVIAYSSPANQGSYQAFMSFTWEGEFKQAKRFTSHLVVFYRGRILEYTATTLPYQGGVLYLRRDMPRVRLGGKAAARQPLDLPPPPDLPPRPPRPMRPPLSRWKKRDNSEDGSRIELLVGYTNDVLADVNSDEAIIRARTGTAVCAFNDALRRSGVSTMICVTGFVLVDMDENGASDVDLLADVQAVEDLRRTRYDQKADVVTVLVARSRMNDLGEGEIWKSGDGYFAERAYSITSWLNMEGGVALAHEVAHNFACQHNTDPDNPRDAYGHGFVYFAQVEVTDWITGGSYFVSQRRCTLMGKASENASCVLERVFSNPNKTDPEGDSAGVAVGEVGTANNARVIRKNLRLFANWGNNLDPVP